MWLLWYQDWDWLSLTAWEEHVEDGINSIPDGSFSFPFVVGLQIFRYGMLGLGCAYLPVAPCMSLTIREAAFPGLWCETPTTSESSSLGEQNISGSYICFSQNNISLLESKLKINIVEYVFFFLFYRSPTENRSPMQMMWWHGNKIRMQCQECVSNWHSTFHASNV